MKKYKEIFSKGFFYIIWAVIVIIELFKEVIKFGDIYFSGLLGIVIGSFICSLFLSTIIYFISKGIDQSKKYKGKEGKRKKK